MKTITLTQPWATLVATGWKRVETRSWRTNYRGPIAIHSSKGLPLWCRDLCDKDPFWTALGKNERVEMPRGQVIATAKLLGCVRAEEFLTRPAFSDLCTQTEVAFGDYSDGRFAWIFSDVKKFEKPIPAKGALGLWDWQEEA